MPKRLDKIVNACIGYHVAAIPVEEIERCKEVWDNRELLKTYFKAEVPSKADSREEMLSKFYHNINVSLQNPLQREDVDAFVLTLETIKWVRPLTQDTLAARVSSLHYIHW